MLKQSDTVQAVQAVPKQKIYCKKAKTITWILDEGWWIDDEWTWFECWMLSKDWKKYVIRTSSATTSVPVTNAITCDRRGFFLTVNWGIWVYWVFEHRYDPWLRQSWIGIFSVVRQSNRNNHIQDIKESKTLRRFRRGANALSDVFLWRRAKPEVPKNFSRSVQVLDLCGVFKSESTNVGSKCSDGLGHVLTSSRWYSLYVQQSPKAMTRPKVSTFG